MTDKEVIKALERHLNDETHCSPCPYEIHSVTHECVEMLVSDALDLINRQQAEIEQWKEEANRYQTLWCEDAQTARAEAYKEFAERLKDCGTLPDLPWDIWKTFADAIDNLVKEMVGEQE